MAAAFCSSVIPPKDELDRYKSISLKLYEVLGDVGVSGEIRRATVDCVDATEILMTLSQPLSVRSVYHFGSQSECSVIPGSDTDRDIVIIHTNMRVETNIVDGHDSDGFLLVPDTQPGYAKLQVRGKGHSLTNLNDNLMLMMSKMVDSNFEFQCDSFNRVCLTRNWQHDVGYATNRQGPAIHMPATDILSSGDIVYALNCETWPECAKEWLTRERQHGWPSAEVIDKCKILGFLLVQVGHPDSDEPHLQWRISFSHQELILVRGFNSVQMKCYVLLKYIKKYHIQANIEEETLTSYHCKTCMFHCIENTPADFWVPENLAGCLLMCLRLLMVWVTNDNCPNYFIPGENMFDRIRSKTPKKQLLDTLRQIIFVCFGGLLKGLQNAILYVARQLHQNMESTQIINVKLDLITRDLSLLSNKAVLSQCCKDHCVTSKMIAIIHDVMLSRINVLRYLVSNDVFININYKLQTKVDIDKLQTKVTQLEQTTRVTDHTEEQSKEAISLLLPFLQLNMLSLRVVETLGKEEEKLQEILEDQKWSDLGVAMRSSKLKHACVMLMLGYNNKSMGILMSVIQSRKCAKCPLCGCYSNFPSPNAYLITGVLYQQKITIIKQLLTKFFQPCVIFLPNEHHLSPLAINYEMIRAYGHSPIIRKQTQNFQFIKWHDWGVVDGIFLTQFLLYINAKVLGQKSLAIKAIKKMISICNKKFPYHLDTSYNLLGWVFKDRGDTAKAVQCFQKSMSVQPAYNAACWHLCFLICSY